MKETQILFTNEDLEAGIIHVWTQDKRLFNKLMKLDGAVREDYGNVGYGLSLPMRSLLKVSVILGKKGSKKVPF